MQIPPHLFPKSNHDAIDRRRWLVSCGASLLGLSALGTICPIGRLDGGEVPHNIHNRGNSSSGWPFEQTSGNFVVYSNHRLSDSEAYLQELEQLRKDIEELLQVSGEQGMYHVVFFDSEANFREYMQHYFPQVPLRRALFIKHRGPGLVFTYLHDQLQTDIRHEGTHAIVHECFGRLPIWLDEGLAEYFEVSRGERFANSPHLKEIRWKARAGQMPDLERLESEELMSEMDATDYRDAWAWVHFLLHRSKESRQLLLSYLRTMKENSSGPKLHTQVNRLFSDCRSEFVSHFRTYPSSP